jgi:hypothetical protein
MWRSPTTPPDETPAAGRPRRSRWLDIVNLAVSILILAIFVRMIPLLTEGSGYSVNELTVRVENLERAMEAMKGQAAAVPAAARLELLPVDAAGFHDLQRFTGFRIRNTGSATAVNILAIVTLHSVAPAWSMRLTGMEPIEVRAFPSSIAASVRHTQAPSPSGSAEVSAVEIAVMALPPGQTLYVALGLPSDLASPTCAVIQSARMGVRPSRFGPPGMQVALAALPYDFVTQLRTATEQRHRAATFAAVVVCDNCAATASVSGFGLSALADFTAGGVIHDTEGDSLEWVGTARAEFYAPPGIPDPCNEDTGLFADSFAFTSRSGWVYLADLVEDK